MKPSERRALLAQREAERLRREQDPQYEPQSEPERSKRKERRQKDGKPRKTENFFSNNSRLIAFIITSVLIITVFSPFAIDMLLERLDDNKTVTDKKDIVCSGDCENCPINETDCDGDCEKCPCYNKCE